MRVITWRTSRLLTSKTSKYCKVNFLFVACPVANTSTDFTTTLPPTSPLTCYDKLVEVLLPLMHAIYLIVCNLILFNLLTAMFKCANNTSIFYFLFRVSVSTFMYYACFKATLSHELRKRRPSTGRFYAFVLPLSTWTGLQFRHRSFLCGTFCSSSATSSFPCADFIAQSRSSDSSNLLHLRVLN